MKTTTLLVAADPPALERDPGSVASRVLTVLRNDPDREFRPVDIAKEVGLKSTAVANALRVLTLRGDIQRHRNTAIHNGPGASVYTYNKTSVPTAG